MEDRLQNAAEQMSLALSLGASAEATAMGSHSLETVQTQSLLGRNCPDHICTPQMTTLARDSKKRVWVHSQDEIRVGPSCPPAKRNQGKACGQEAMGNGRYHGVKRQGPWQRWTRHLVSSLSDCCSCPRQCKWLNTMSPALLAH